MNKMIEIRSGTGRVALTAVPMIRHTSLDPASAGTWMIEKI